MTHPTDALRLVPVSALPDEIDLFRIIRRAGRSNREKALAVSVHLDALAAAPASPLPEGGGQCSGITGELKSPDLDALEKLADEATPGPWRWEVSLKSKQVALCGGPPKSGFGAFDHDVMTFRRWGMSGAAPVFWRWEGHLGHPIRADEAAAPVEGREHHASWFRTIDDPNAAFIAAANPATIKALIAELKEARGLMRKWSKMIDEPDVQKCGLASSLLFGIQRAARAFLARNGKGEP